ncbi:hypothetical protein EVAR_58144_1 [Eumeta japonica]|uniref:Uncharacterized protein n=1 Tax=Eumeta variegata TaxID=151549 RepID=A0A4C1X334_EUMVA|nr:hypothetical protein EVAR_58144_1 [Eumeta japonica]
MVWDASVASYNTPSTLKTKITTPPPSRLVPVGDSDQSLPAEILGKNNGVGIKTNEKRKRYTNREEWKRLEEAYVSQATLTNI